MEFLERHISTAFAENVSMCENPFFFILNKSNQANISDFEVKCN